MTGPEHERETRIAALVALWQRKTGKGLRELDAAINKRYQVPDGRNSLTFETIRDIMEKLEKRQ